MITCRPVIIRQSFSLMYARITADVDLHYAYFSSNDLKFGNGTLVPFPALATTIILSF